MEVVSWLNIQPVLLPESRVSDTDRIRDCEHMNGSLDVVADKLLALSTVGR
jgi:hypothetical protein